MIPTFLSQFPSRIEISPDQHIELNQKPSKAFLKLVDETIWGTTGPKYYFFKSADKINDFGTALYCSFHHLGELKAAFTIIIRHDKTNDLITLYGKHFTAFQSNVKGAGVKLIYHVRKAFLQSKIPFVFHAYIDDENQQSLNVCNKFNLVPLAKFKTYNFSRVSPKASSYKIAPINEVSNSYFESQLFHDRNFKKGTFKCQTSDQFQIEVAMNLWRIISLPGFTGQLVTKILPYIPVLNRLINANKFDFLSVVDFSKNFPRNEELEQLFNTLLTKHGVHSIMLWLNHLDPLNQQLESLNWGIIQKANHVKLTNILGYVHLPSPEINQALENNLIKVNAFDIG